MDPVLSHLASHRPVPPAQVPPPLHVPLHDTGHPPSPPSAAEQIALLQAVARAGDRGAFGALFKHYAPRLKSFLLRAGTSPELAEELAQETMVQVWRKAASFDPARAQVSTWIYTIARNLRIDVARRDGSGVMLAAFDADDDDPAAQALQHELAGLPDAAAQPPEQLDHAQREAGVRHALTQLPPEQAQVLRLSYFEDQPHAEIARALSIPLGTVKSRIRLAVAQLRRLLDAHAP